MTLPAKPSHSRKKFLFRVQYLEIYNEVINDLLDPSKTHLHLRETKVGMEVVGITTRTVSTVAAAMEIIAEGTRHRKVGFTKMNSDSSRSHSIFRMIIECDDQSEGTVNYSEMNLVDLAGARGVRGGQHTARVRVACSVVISRPVVPHSSPCARPQAPSEPTRRARAACG